MFDWYYEAVTPEELDFACGLTSAAYQIRAPYINPASLPPFGLIEDDGTTTYLTLTDKPLTRAMLSILKEFGPRKGAALTTRLWALFKMLEIPEIKQFTEPHESEDATKIRFEVVIVAASAPLKRNLNFKRSAFIRAVRKQIALSECSCVEPIGMKDRPYANTR